MTIRKGKSNDNVVLAEKVKLALSNTGQHPHFDII